MSFARQPAPPQKTHCPALATSGRRGRQDGQIQFRGSRPHRQRGYSLIEVIVAFALLALALTLLLGTLSGAARQVRWSGDAGRAAMHAQSLIDQVGVGEPLVASRRDGEFDDGRYRWNLAITPWTDPALPPVAAISPLAPRLFDVALSVQWGDGRGGEQLQLRTLRLAAPGTQALP